MYVTGDKRDVKLNVSVVYKFNALSSVIVDKLTDGLCIGRPWTSDGVLYDLMLVRNLFGKETVNNLSPK